jgi:hypothetical protein
MLYSIVNSRKLQMKELKAVQTMIRILTRIIPILNEVSIYEFRDLYGVVISFYSEVDYLYT